MLCTIITLSFVLLFVLRASYINLICSDWNYKLGIYIEHYSNSNDLTEENVSRNLNYMNDRELMPMRYWFLLNKWSVKRIIKDPILYQNVDKHLKKRYDNKIANK